MLLRWRIPAPPFDLRFRGPQGALVMAQRTPLENLAGFLVPGADIPAGGVSRGSPGLKIVGNEVRLNIAGLPLAPEN